MNEFTDAIEQVNDAVMYDLGQVVGAALIIAGTFLAGVYLWHFFKRFAYYSNGDREFESSPGYQSRHYDRDYSGYQQWKAEKEDAESMKRDGL